MSSACVVEILVDSRSPKLVDRASDEAEQLYIKAIAIGEKPMGSEHPDLAV